MDWKSRLTLWSWSRQTEVKGETIKHLLKFARFITASFLLFFHLSVFKGCIPVLLRGMRRKRPLTSGTLGKHPCCCLEISGCQAMDQSDGFPATDMWHSLSCAGDYIKGSCCLGWLTPSFLNELVEGLHLLAKADMNQTMQLCRCSADISTFQLCRK